MNHPEKTISKLLVANRSEIAIRVFRSAHELGIRTVAIYAWEDRAALHRFKADEAYQVGNKGEPIRSYLNIDNIIEVAKRYHVDAIHPGYGFLSENPELARACEHAGIIFVGPSVHSLEALGDKITARNIARKVGVPVLGGSNRPITTIDDGLQQAEDQTFPVILKAAKGGGGRGMRVVREASQFAAAFESAQRESLTAFGSPDIFVEKYIERAKHIEVQLLGDKHGNLVHLFERDCSVQRRHQKVVEIAPAPVLNPQTRQALLDASVAIGKEVQYQHAGTVEFLVDVDTNKYYFIEVNPRIQVEHTVTEQVTGIDLVKSQILVAQGSPLSHDDIGIPTQDSVKVNGFAIQCRVTTEDPSNDFLPDYGRMTNYRSAAGMGIRLDAGTAFSGAVVNPYYDSLLVKVSAWGRRFIDAITRMERSLQEFRVRGVKTNLPFLMKLMTNEEFKAATCTTRFIDETPELFQYTKRRDRASKLLTFLGDVTINGNPVVSGQVKATRREPARVPKVDLQQPLPKGTRDRLKELGPKGFSQWITEQKLPLITDTTFRDAHQSLLATRFRTYDLLQIADVYARWCPQLFSLEMWGGATFDTSMRFLKECPWQRLAEMRARVPNILFQMLLRASNAVGYTNYPDNVVKAFVKESAQAGIDVFRVFDALNWVPNMQVAMDAVLDAGAICEPAICYTGDILNPKRTKYSLKYYVDLAKDLEKRGAHILAIKDMAGLCKPYAAKLLVETLKQEIGIPIHFHTHDTAGVQSGSILRSVEAGLDIFDAAMAPMSGGTSQPNLNTLVEALRFSPKDTGLNSEHLDELAEYWRAVREFYKPFDGESVPATSDLYRHEMPGGQYTNLYQQAKALGLSERWAEVCLVYAEVNQLFGDIVKVTPTSKSVGDMALFMVANNLKSQDVLDSDRELAYPESVIDLIGGKMGQPPGGFPEQVKKRILRGQPGLTDRPGATLPPVDFAATGEEVKKFLKREPTTQEVLSYLMYPKVYREFAAHQAEYFDTSVLPTPAFFFGQDAGEEIAVEIEPGKTLIIKYLTQGDTHPDGTQTVFFELNGQPREVTITNRKLEPTGQRNAKADLADPKQVGAGMPGMVVSVNVKIGDHVKKGQKLLTVEAMKMESTVYAEQDGIIAQVLVTPATQIQTGDLLLTYK